MRAARRTAATAQGLADAALSKFEGANELLVSLQVGSLLEHRLLRCSIGPMRGELQELKGESQMLANGVGPMRGKLHELVSEHQVLPSGFVPLIG